MTRIWVIALREFKATVFTWAFALSVALVPLGTIGTAVLGPKALELTGVLQERPVEGLVLVADDASLIEALIAEADEPLSVRVEPAGPADQATARVGRGEALALVERSGRRLVVGEVPIQDRAALARWVGEARARERAAAEGLDIERLRTIVQAARPEVVSVSEAGPTADAQGPDVRELSQLVVAFTAEMLLWLGAFVSAQYLLHNTIEERSSKVLEVLLSAVSPMQLLAGKILGLGMVGLVMTAAYGSALVAGLAAFAATDALSLSKLALFVVFYALGYLQLGGVFAAIGSAVNDVREAQSLMTPAVVVMTVPFLVLPLVLADPNGTAAAVLSLVPPLTPFVLVFRALMPGSDVPAWQIGVGLVGSALWAGAMLWASARVFRVGVLMRGKAPGPIELARWIFVD